MFAEEMSHWYPKSSTAWDESLVFLSEPELHCVQLVQLAQLCRV